MNYADTAAAQQQERLARGWMSSCWARVANLERKVANAVISNDGTAARMRAELEIARNVARAATEDSQGWRRICRQLAG